jgi:hypothetical protein
MATAKGVKDPLTMFKPVLSHASENVFREVIFSASVGTPNNLYTFSVTMEFREDDGKGNFVAVPRDRVLFKLRCNTQKKIFVAVTQTTNKDLVIER